MTDLYKDYELKNPKKFQRRFGRSLLNNLFFVNFMQTRISFIVQECKKFKGPIKICDVGAGTGLASTLLRSKLSSKDSLIEVDNSHYLLSKFDSPWRVCADGLNLPFADNSFDIVYCMDYLHHVSDIQKAANELLRISKNVVVIIEPNKFNPIYFIYALLCKEERGILDVGYKKIKKIFPHNEIEFIEPLPFHAIIGRTFPYRVLSKIFETLKLTRLFATYVLIAKK